MRTVAALLLALTLVGPASAAQRIMFDPGGVIQVFIDRYNGWRVSGERVIVDGFCISACTLVVALIPEENICATRYARLAFHSASSFNPMTGETRFAREATRLMWRMYPKHVREILLRHGWQDGMEHESLIYIEGDDLHAMIRPCTDSDMAALTPTGD